NAGSKLPDPVKAGVAEKLFRLDCGRSLANDESVWTPGENAGRSIEFSSTCWLIKHGSRLGVFLFRCFRGWNQDQRTKRKRRQSHARADVPELSSACREVRLCLRKDARVCSHTAGMINRLPSFKEQTFVVLRSRL